VLKLSALRACSQRLSRSGHIRQRAALAAERGVTAEISTASESPDHRSLLDVRVPACRLTHQRRRDPVGSQLVEKIVQINAATSICAPRAPTW